MGIRTIERIQGEERDGFYVQPLMKRAWAVELEILKEIDAICRRHQIRYFAQFGTLLGAVRHHGFIPWDDDLDLAMLRSDFEKFQHYARAELPEGWRISKTGPTLICIANGDEIRLDQEFLDRYHGCPYVMGVDIFAMDNLPRDKAEEKLLVNLFDAVYNLHEHWDSFEEDCRKENLIGEDKWQRLNELEALTGHHFNRRNPVREQLCELADHIAAMYWDTECDEVAFVYRLHAEPDHRIPRSCFERITEVPFEHTTIPILEDSDLLLRLMFGDDYMTPVRGCASHGYPFFRDQIEHLRNWFGEQGEAMPEFFDMVMEQGDQPDDF